MTLDELIERLGREDPAHVVENGFGNPHSYRGYYERVAFEPVAQTTIGDMLREAKSALGATYCGWKGGEYVMHKFTECHLAPKGDCGPAIEHATIDAMLLRRDLAAMTKRAEASEAKVAALEAQLAEQEAVVEAAVRQAKEQPSPGTRLTPEQRGHYDLDHLAMLAEKYPWLRATVDVENAVRAMLAARAKREGNALGQVVVM